MYIEILQFLIYSSIIVLVSKYLLVKILRKIGELLKLKPKTVGNISGIATSIPELLTVAFSSLSGLMAASTYNIISSNGINLVQYVAAIILNKNQKVLKNQAIQVDLWLVLFTIFIPVIMVFFNIDNKIGIVPLLIILLFLFFKISNNAHKLYMKEELKQENQEASKKENIVIKENEQEKEINKEEIMENINISVENYTKKEVSAVVIQGVLLAGVGILLYIVGNLLGDVLNRLCINFNIPQVIIGILLGCITSIPEFITFIESQKHHKTDKEGVIEATGNLLTSNIMNLFIIQSIGIIIYHIF